LKPRNVTTPAAAGFTLIELISAMAIGTLVLLVAASLLGQVGSDYGRVNGGVGAEREARAAISQITADAASAWPHPDAVFEAVDDPWPRDRLAFLSLQPAAAQSDEGRSGDLCAVNYYVKDLAFGDGTVRCLMRGFRESEESFAALKDGELASLFGEAPRDEPVAFGIAGFEARPVVRGARGEWQPWQPATTPGEESSTEDADEGGPPEALLLRLLVARREVLGRLSTPADWSGEGADAGVLGDPQEANRNKNLRVFESVLRFGPP
jgi:prepilin-type N-terminal cleavage/methylation domain-containing protein